MSLLSGTHIGPLWAAHMRLSALDPYGSYISHTGPKWACYLGPTWVLYGSAHMGLTVCEPYGRAHMGKLVSVCNP